MSNSTYYTQNQNKSGASETPALTALNTFQPRVHCTHYMGTLEQTWDLLYQHVAHYFSSLQASLFFTTSSPPPPPSPYSLENTFPWVLFAGLALFQFLLNWCIKTCLATPIANRCLFGQLQTNAPPQQFKKRTTLLEKFAQANVEAVFYFSYFVMGVAIILQAPWLWPSTLWWKGRDTEGKLIVPLNMAETTFYVAYAARYFAFFINVFLEPKRKDFWEMQIHHVTTVVLVYVSFVSGFVRVGFVVMVLLDFADTFLHVAKQCKYTQDGRTMAGLGQQTMTKLASTCADVWFALFAAAFTITRIGMYGYVTWSCWYEATHYFIVHEQYGVSNTWTFQKAVLHVMLQGEPVFICQVLISVLFVLMCIWEYLLVQAVVKVVSGNPLRDNRSDSEGDLKVE